MDDINYFIISDLHLENKLNTTPKDWGNYLYNGKKSNICILAGDIGRVDQDKYKNILDRFLKWCASIWNLVLYVPGNHEYYGVSIEKGNSIIGELCKTHNIKFMAPGVYVHNNVAIIGATLWSDVPVSCQNVIKSGMNDYYKIKGHSIENNNLYFKNELNYILEKVVMCHHDDITDIIVVTHHCPDLELARIKFSDLTEGYGTNILHNFEKYNSKLKTWVYGHTHQNRNATICGINVICNQVGYSYIMAKRYGYLNDKIRLDNDRIDESEAKYIEEMLILLSIDTCQEQDSNISDDDFSDIIN